MHDLPTAMNYAVIVCSIPEVHFTSFFAIPRRTKGEMCPTVIQTFVIVYNEICFTVIGRPRNCLQIKSMISERKLPMFTSKKKKKKKRPASAEFF